MVERVLLASPRGYCAGVERAVETVELALEHYGAPVYVRKQIVHNIHVVRDLEARGAIFVEEETEVPRRSDGGLLRPRRRAVGLRELGEARHNVIDAVCPLVTKVHVQARRYADEGYTVVLIGHEGHEEVVGTMGEAPDATVLVETVEEAERRPPARARSSPRSRRRRCPSTRPARSSLRCAPVPRSARRASEDICYATSNRQGAVKEMLPEVDLLLVIGSRNSSNSNQLVEVARVGHAIVPHRRRERDRRVVARRRHHRGDHVRGVGAQEARQRVCEWFRVRGVTNIEPTASSRRTSRSASRSSSGVSSSWRCGELALREGELVASCIDRDRRASRARSSRGAREDRRPPPGSSGEFDR